MESDSAFLIRIALNGVTALEIDRLKGIAERLEWLEAEVVKASVKRPLRIHHAPHDGVAEDICSVFYEDVTDEPPYPKHAGASFVFPLFDKLGRRQHTAGHLADVFRSLAEGSFVVIDNDQEAKISR